VIKKALAWLKGTKAALGLFLAALVAFLVAWSARQSSKRKLKSLHSKQLALEKEKQSLSVIDDDQEQRLESIKEETAAKIIEVQERAEDLRAAAESSKAALSSQLNRLFK
jgi:uncharacterized membrane protein YhiD involved in acid resistance